MHRSTIISRIRAHEAELKDAGVEHLSPHGSRLAGQQARRLPASISSPVSIAAEDFLSSAGSTSKIVSPAYQA